MRNLLASLTVVPPALQQACSAIREELGPYVAVVDPVWQPFARACGVRESDRAPGGLPLFVGPDHAWLRSELENWRQPPSSSSADFEFGLVFPVSLPDRARTPTDLTLQLWQNGYTPVTVHRIAVDCGGNTIEVVAAVARPTPPRP